eukprot:3277906-Amphidinium_carterae.1
MRVPANAGGMDHGLDRLLPTESASHHRDTIKHTIITSLGMQSGLELRQVGIVDVALKQARQHRKHELGVGIISSLRDVLCYKRYSIFGQTFGGLLGQRAK